MKYRYILFSCLLLFALLFRFPISAQDGDVETDSTVKLPAEYGDFLESIPEDIRAYLPDGLFSANGETVGEAVAEISDFSYLLQTVLSLVGLRIGDCAHLLVSVLGLLLLSALCNTLRQSIGSAQLGRAFSFCSALVITVALLSQSVSVLESVTAYFSTLNTLTAASLPLMSALYAMGGNVSAAAASGAGLSVFMTLLEELVGKSILPFCGICMAFALVGALEPSLRTGTLLSTLKKNYTTVLAFLMMLLLAMLSTQTVLGARADTLMMRSAKFAAGNMIPVVGGSVAELLRTVSAGVSFLRGTVGLCGTLLLILTLLPTLIELLLFRFVWQLCASVADLLGCDSEKKLLDEFSSLLGFLITAVSICSSVLMLSLALLTHCAVAIGG